MNSYETQVRSLEEERDRYRRELMRYKRPTKDPKDFDESQLSKVIREKEDLQLLLNKFERHMAEVSRMMKNFTEIRFCSFRFKEISKC